MVHTKIQNIFLLMILAVSVSACGKLNNLAAGGKANDWRWSAEHNHYMPHAEHDPYLEFEKHLQIAQWSHQDWVAEDWIAQFNDPKDIIDGFYNADILRDQIINEGRTVLVVGPNFYRLSGFDKHRVTHVIDVIYGITKSAPEAAFFLTDWKTKQYIGVQDKHGLRLH